MNRIIVATLFATCAAVVSPLSFAEESADFAARFASLQERAQDHAAANINTQDSDTQPSQARRSAETTPRADS